MNDVQQSKSPYLNNLTPMHSQARKISIYKNSEVKRSGGLKNLVKQIAFKINKNNFSENLPFRKKKESFKKNEIINSLKNKVDLPKKQDQSQNQENLGEITENTNTEFNLKVPILISDMSCDEDNRKINNYVKASMKESIKINERKLEKLKNIQDSDENQNSITPNFQLILDKNSKFMFFWEIYIFYLMMYCITILAFRVCFFLNQQLSFFLIFEFLIEISFLFDFVIHFLTSYRDFHENLILDHKLIFLNYLKTWLIFDFISSYPANIIGFCNISNSLIPKDILVWNVLKLFKCLKMIKLLDSSKKSVISLIFRGLNLNSDKALKRLVKFTLISIFVVHVFTCFWIYIGFSEIYPKTWIKASNLQHSAVSEIYITSLYFNFVTVLTIGYGDILSTNTLERGCNIFIMLIGGFLFSFTISCLSMIFFRKNSKDEKYKEKMELLNKYDKNFDIPKKLYEELKKTISHQVKISNLDKYSLFDDLPNNLKNEFLISINKIYMDSFVLFENCPHQFMLFILPLLKPIVTMKSKTLFSEGEFIEEIYFVKKGSLSVQMGIEYDNLEIGLIQENFHFGEILMYSSEKSPYFLTVKSKISEIYVLKKNDFSKAKLLFDEVVINILSRSYETLRIIENRRKVIMTIYEFEYDLKDILRKINFFDYRLLNRDFEKYYFFNKIPEDAFNFLSNYEYKEIKEIISTCQNEDIDFIFPIKKLSKQEKDKGSSSLLKRVSDFDPKIIRNFYKQTFNYDDINNRKSLQIKKKTPSHEFTPKTKYKYRDRLSTNEKTSDFLKKKISNERKINEEKSKKKCQKKKFINHYHITKIKDFKKNVLMPLKELKQYEFEEESLTIRNKTPKKIISSVMLKSNCLNLCNPKSQNQKEFVGRRLEDFPKTSKKPFLNFQDIIEEIQLDAITQFDENNALKGIKEYLGNEKYMNSRRSDKPLKRFYSIKVKKKPEID